MKSFRFCLGCVLVLASTGCVVVKSSHVVTGNLGAPVNGDVRVILDGQETPLGYREIAIVEARGNSRAGMPGVIGRMRDDARKLGANAIVNVRVDQGASIVSGTGVAVRY